MNLKDFTYLRVFHCLVSILSSLMLRDSIASRISWMTTRNHFSYWILKEHVTASFIRMIVDWVAGIIEANIIIVAVITAA